MRAFHDPTDTFYRMPQGAMPCGGKVRLRLGLSEQAYAVSLRLWTGTESQSSMRFLGAYGGWMLYETELIVPDRPGLCWYSFLIRTKDATLWFGKGMTQCSVHQPESFQMTVYDANTHIPDWFRDGVIYQIFPDRFFREDIGEDGAIRPDPMDNAAEKQPMNARMHPLLHENWYEKPFLQVAGNGDNLANDFFGGTLRGITAKLDEIRDLGANILYLNPIFLSPSNHRYNTSDYELIDPRLGTADDLRVLCAEAHKRNMHVLLDGVFSHTGDDSRYFNRYGSFDGKGACQGEDSPYYKWYSFEKFPHKYRCWWGFDTLPEVDEDSDDFTRYITGENGIIARWMRLGVDGWRLDVADELPMRFLKSVREAVRKAKPDGGLLGEVWEDASNKEAYGEVRCYFTGETLDGVMNYPLRDMLIDFMLGKRDAPSVAAEYMTLVRNYPRENLLACMNLLGSHDRPRLLSLMAGMDAEMPREKQMNAHIPVHRLARARKRANALFRFVCALPGMPAVYYGDEVGMEGLKDPFNRGTYPWGRGDAAMRETWKNALWFRRSEKLLQDGDVLLTAVTDDVLCVRRFDSGRRMLEAYCNRSDSSVQVLRTDAEGNLIEKVCLEPLATTFFLELKIE